MTDRRPTYNSLDDYLLAEPLTVNGQLDDGGGLRFPVKGRELEATILFADIASFSARTANLDPTETLAFVNHFFTWSLAEGLQGTPGIVDKYIGDAVMIVFSKDFGSDDPFADAVRVGAGMGSNDAFSFHPHVGIASGTVIAGYVGTPARYSCSVFGAPVAVAARCSSVRPEGDHLGSFSAWVTFPEADWGARDLGTTIPPGRTLFPDGTSQENLQPWELTEPRTVPFRNMGEHSVQHLISRAFSQTDSPAEDRARNGVAKIAERRRKWSRSELPGPPKPVYPEGFLENFGRTPVDE